MKRLGWLLAVAAVGSAYAQGTESKKATPAPEKAAPVKKEAAAPAAQVLKATGSGAPDLKARTPAQARLGAERAAQMDAFRNLLAQAKGIQLSEGKTVGDEMAREEIRARVEGVIRGYKVTAKRYFSDNGVEIDVEVPVAAFTELFPGDAKATPALSTNKQ